VSGSDSQFGNSVPESAKNAAEGSTMAPGSMFASLGPFHFRKCVCMSNGTDSITCLDVMTSENRKSLIEFEQHRKQLGVNVSRVVTGPWIVWFQALHKLSNGAIATLVIAELDLVRPDPIHTVPVEIIPEPKPATLF